MGLFDFMANAPPGDPSSYQALEMRRKIAMQMLANQRKGYPKNLGEGLTAIGDALADRKAMQMMEGQQAAFDQYNKDNPPPDAATLLTQPPPPTPTPTTGRRSDASDDETIAPRPPVVAADDDAESVPAQRTALVSPPPQTAMPVSQPAVPPPPLMNDAQSSQMASLMGRGPGSQPSPFAATASLDSPDTASDAPPANPLVRDAIARTLAQRAGVPPQNPLLATGTVPSSLPATPLAPAGAGSPVDVPLQTGIRAVPPEQPPGVQVAQAGPAPGIPQINRVTPPVTMPPPGPVSDQPAPAPMNRAEIEGMRRKQMGIQQQNPVMMQQGDLLLQEGAKARAKQDADNMAAWKEKIETERQRRLPQEAAERGAPLAQQQLIEAQAKAADAQRVNRFGGQANYQKFVDDVSEGRKTITPLANTLPMYEQAKTALKGAYTGAGAEVKLDASKMLRGLGVPGDYSPSVATEILRSRMSAIAAGFVKGTVGSTNISNQDVKFVQQAYSGEISMEPESIRKLLNIAQKAAIDTINQHNDRLIGMTGHSDDQMIRNQYRVPMQYGNDAEILKQQGQDPKIRDYFDQKYGKGHADAVLRGKSYGD